MPIYRYMCDVCDEVISLRVSFNESDNEVICPNCLEEAEVSSKMKRLISPANVIYKGKDFYTTESKSKQQKPEWDG